jgi:hypothetical protein
MSRHTTYRGATIDMDTMRRENEKVPALGNMGVNAKGDQIARGGTITKTADQLARENHRVQSSIIHAGLKGPVPESPATVIDTPKTPVKPTTIKKTKETELPSGDIIIEDDKV